VLANTAGEAVGRYRYSSSENSVSNKALLGMFFHLDFTLCGLLVFF